MQKVRFPLIGALVTLVFLALASIGFQTSGTHPTGVLRVSFLDVGQGDSILIESPTGTQVLIDGGADSRVLTELSHALGFFDKEIDMVVATHPDADHIGGLIDVLMRYKVDTILMTENKNDTPVADTFRKMVEEEGARVIYARAGQVYDLGSGEQGSTTLTILFPDRDPTNLESNESSIVARLVYGTSSYLFTGDSPASIETYLVHLYGASLTSNVLKAGHHGSRTSTSEIFLDAVMPTYAIISAGKDNRYGHPHAEVITKLQHRNISILNTADEGTIEMSSDGVGMTVQ